MKKSIFNFEKFTERNHFKESTYSIAFRGKRMFFSKKFCAEEDIRNYTHVDLFYDCDKATIGIKLIHYKMKNYERKFTKDSKKITRVYREGIIQNASVRVACCFVCYIRTKVNINIGKVI